MNTAGGGILGAAAFAALGISMNCDLGRDSGVRGIISGDAGAFIAASASGCS
jgi:hypothetical protein